MNDMKPWDHGTGEQAIEWMLHVNPDTDVGNGWDFLRAWQDGTAREEWPEFYDWLAGERREIKRPLLCRLGLHRWKYAAPDFTGTACVEECRRCRRLRWLSFFGGYIYGGRA